MLFRSDEQRYRGVMAKDVEKYMPEAVQVREDGMLTVNYAMLGVDMIPVAKGA